MGKLEARNIEKYFKHDGKPLKTLDGIDLNVQDGEFLCIVGPSGCGKSTFLRITAGLEKPDNGEILLDGKPLSSTGPDRIMVFQEGALFPWLNVQDNVEYGLKIAGIPKEKRNEISNRYLDMMQLTQFATSFTSARVGVRPSIIDSIIWVATITGMRARLACCTNSF